MSKITRIKTIEAKPTAAYIKNGDVRLRF